MTGLERRTWWRNLAVGLCLTAGVFVGYLAGLLDVPENWMSDVRMRRCQMFAGAPTNQLVHLDIDDASLETVGSWPWPRHMMADILDELHAAGAKAVALDILYAERAPSAQGQEAGAAGITSSDRDDAALGRAIARAGNVVISASFKLNLSHVANQDLLKLLRTDLETTPDQANEVLRRRGLPAASDDDFYAALHQAMQERIEAEESAGPIDLDRLRARLLPRTSELLADTVAGKVLVMELRRFRAMQAMRRFGRPTPPDAPPIRQCNEVMAPLPELAEAAKGCGFIDFLQSQGVVRSLPLWTDDRGGLVPQMALALACVYLDVEPRTVRVTASSVELDPPGKPPIVIPVRTVRSASRGPVGTMMEVPLFGTSNWLTMYDYPRHQQAAQHETILKAWDIIDTRRRIRENNSQIDEAIPLLLLKSEGEDAARGFDPHALAPEDFAARQRIIAKDQPFYDGALEAYEQETPEQAQRRPPIDQKVYASLRAVREARRQNERLLLQLKDKRAELGNLVRGKAVLIGTTATAAGDVVRTALHQTCPGVVLHGAVFNAIVTGHFKRPAPGWLDGMLVLAFGILTTIIVIRLSPRAAFACTLALTLAYALINGFVLFDKMGWMVALAGPLAAAGVVWAALTVTQFAVEWAERARITSRFRYYVDPVLVNYVIDHPEQVRFGGEMRELTVAVTDLVGFTAMTEQLREKTVEVLNQYMNCMVPLIRSRGGYVNKFLGDGIMFFFGAPLARRDHAAAAVAAVLDMHTATDAFASQRSDDPCALSMRAGISSGTMVVGDAGADAGSDYTVLGDAVNVCFRLEPANKVFGSRTLITESTLRLLEGQFLVRCVGLLLLYGRAEPVMAYEPLCLITQATDSQRQLAELTDRVVSNFIAGQFDACLAAVERLESDFGQSLLSRLYARLAGEHQAACPPDFDGRVVIGK